MKSPVVELHSLLKFFCLSHGLKIQARSQEFLSAQDFGSSESQSQI